LYAALMTFFRPVVLVGGGTSARAAAMSTVAVQVRKSLAVISAPLISFR
jgi:hypothetical protein